MAWRFILPVLFAIFVGTTAYYGCIGEPKAIDNKSEVEYGSKTAASDYSGCYLVLSGIDSSLLYLKKENERYIGEIVRIKHYKNNKREVKQNTLFLYNDGDYLTGTLMVSNDSIHYSQMRFVKHGTELIEGYGDTKVEKDSLVFKHPSNLEFDIANPYKRISCP